MNLPDEEEDCVGRTHPPKSITKMICIINKVDQINHPLHYTEGRRFEPWDVIDDWGLGFGLGNAVKYIARAGRKDDALEDLKKAEVYLRREIEKLEGKNA